MRTTTIATILIAACLPIAACNTNEVAGKNTTAGAPAPSTTTASAPARTALDATATFNEIAKAVPTTKLTQTVTAENDENHLLGRPGQYTSKIAFSDSRIKGDDAAMYKTGDIELGGSIEVFPDAASAKARATYIQTVTKGMPALAEYDYPVGAVVVRVSRYLTPTQAGEYETAAKKLG
ncbi:hypothetical protein [Streptomyces sp. NPDC005125]